MIKIAVLGTGKIIPEAVAAMKASEKFEVATIWARPHSKDKADKLAEISGIGKVTTDLDEIFSDDSIKFVYIGLVNSVHYEYARRALEAGKNVILEKPFTTSLNDARDLVGIAKHQRLYLFEAVTNLHMPNFHAVKDALGKIGTVKLVQCNYSQYSSRYDAYKAYKVAPAFDPNTNGGSLFDLNVYNINFVVGLFGAPENVSYTPNKGWNSVDTSGSLVMKYHGFTATCNAAKDSASPCFLIVQGDKGYIYSQGSPNEFNSFDLVIRGEEPKHFELNKFDHRMVHEFAEFGEIFESGNYKAVESGLQTSLDVMKILESVSKNAE